MKTDITIIGAGLVGLTAACALAKQGLEIAIIDSSDLAEAHKKEADGRTSAIAAGSAAFFKEIGVWDDLLPHAGEIRDIRVTDGNAPVFLHYDHALIGDAPMGYIIENFHLRNALFNKAKEYKNIKIFAPAKYSNVEFGDDGCTLSLWERDGERVKTSSNIGRNPHPNPLPEGEGIYRITSALLIAADGKNSNIRKLAGIRTHEWNYNQSGIVCTIAHEKHHQFTAQERFLPDGPFAVLPMAGGYHSSLVWTERTHLVPTYMAMSAEEIEEQITLRTGEYLGKITLASKMFSYPLSMCKAKTYIGKNLCLIGDAAHAMHPLAGQGFNVGIRDVEKLAELIFQGIRDKGLGGKEFLSLTPNLSSLLEEYNSSRMADSIALIAITDILNRAFSNNILPLQAARRIGMAAVNRINPLKKFFMRHAMGE